MQFNLNDEKNTIRLLRNKHKIKRKNVIRDKILYIAYERKKYNLCRSIIKDYMQYSRGLIEECDILSLPIKSLLLCKTLLSDPKVKQEWNFAIPNIKELLNSLLILGHKESVDDIIFNEENDVCLITTYNEGYYDLVLRTLELRGKCNDRNFIFPSIEDAGNLLIMSVKNKDIFMIKQLVPITNKIIVNAVKMGSGVDIYLERYVQHYIKALQKLVSVNDYDTCLAMENSWESSRYILKCLAKRYNISYMKYELQSALKSVKDKYYVYCS